MCICVIAVSFLYNEKDNQKSKLAQESKIYCLLHRHIAKAHEHEENTLLIQQQKHRQISTDVFGNTFQKYNNIIRNL